MPNLITLGCSLSPYGGCPQGISEYLGNDYDWYHYAMGGSSNGIQLFLLEDHIIKHGIGSNDVFIFEITGKNRPWGIETQFKFDKDAGLTFENEYDIFTGLGNFKKVLSPVDNKPRYVLLQHHPYIQNNVNTVDGISRFGVNFYDPYIELQRLLFTLILIKKSGSTVIVYRGWEGAIEKETWDIFTFQFIKHGIDFLNECFVEWCMEHKLPFLDDFHPKPKDSRIFAKELIEPFLDRHKK